jgi:hypothetical protein
MTENALYAEIDRLTAINKELVAALQEIIEECPKPTLPYGLKVVDIAKQALARAEATK